MSIIINLFCYSRHHVFSMQIEGSTLPLGHINNSQVWWKPAASGGTLYDAGLLMPPPPPPEPSAIKPDLVREYGGRGRMTALEIAKLKLFSTFL